MVSRGKSRAENSCCPVVPLLKAHTRSLRVQTTFTEVEKPRSATATVAPGGCTVNTVPTALEVVKFRVAVASTC